MKLNVYQEWLRINEGFDLVLRVLKAMRKYHAFGAGELECFRQLSKETRAAINSYLAEIVERAESAEAGHRFQQRRKRGQADEQASEPLSMPLLP